MGPVPAIPPTTLRTDRLLLRAFTSDDEDAVLAACEDAEIQRWTTVPSPYRRAHARAFVRELVPSWWAEGSAAVFAVERRGELAACVGLHRRRPDPAVAEIGFWCAPGHRGRGVVTEAVAEVAAWGFDQLGLARLEWYAEVGNLASRRVADKLGFAPEGVARGLIAHRGVRVDVWCAALLAGELVRPGPPSD
ncbi:RimJ/RimL family protein N-acetyltransferase [Motilibacter peucedani]|uniref:RimJ/RimL family protein N-acetyltransferase n=1 Tax=Motilibacter peucedani TaxID=598650 RepID=A0A420XNQ2_9ACTN|nr:RimJ/RimL family protein N-acetyltransferase [Motilibacter peucedani]